MNEQLHTEYDDAANILGWDGKEGGYQGRPHWDTWDLLTDQIELDLPNDDHNSTLLLALIDGIDELVWCDAAGYMPTDQEAVNWSWRQFSELVQHKRRYFFFSDADPEDGGPMMSAKELLDLALDYSVRFGLIREFPTGTKFHRARYQKEGEQLSTAQELGPPPVDKALFANRMSPPGIPMMYASDHLTTALRETANEPGTFAVGKFESTKPLLILDLVDIPKARSIFEPLSDSAEYDPQRPVRFLHSVGWLIAEPVPRRSEGNIIDYVPTQVFTEYARIFKLPDGRSIDGIRYRSSVHFNHASYVLFITQEEQRYTDEQPALTLKSVTESEVTSIDW